MTRFVWPLAFQLYAGVLDNKLQIKLGMEVREKFFNENKELGNIPVALRWLTVPAFGFPRAPFEVWRRPRDYKPNKGLINEPFKVNGLFNTYWSLGEMYEVMFQALPAVSQTMVVEALDSRGKPIPGQRIVFTNSRQGLFRSPGIAGLRVQGNGIIRNVIGFGQDELANLPGWKRIEKVGLPYKKSEAGLPEYSPDMQGLEPPSMEGHDAAIRRLAISEFMSLPIPATGIATVIAPPWNAPDPADYIMALRDTSPGLFELIRKCLSSTDDTDPVNMQLMFRPGITIPGITQSGVTGATPGDPADAEIPVVGIAMLAISSDNDASLGLGYGTLDFPPSWKVDPMKEVQMPPGMIVPMVDYMVTAKFVTPFFDELEFAALAQILPPPESAQALLAKVFSVNRARALDEESSEAVELSWNFPTHAQGYGILAQHGSAAADYLNAMRPFKAGGYDPYIPRQPASINGMPPAGRKAVFMDSVSPVPKAGFLTSRYLVIGRDVFARWSGWTQTAHTAVAPPVTEPGLNSALLELDTTPIVAGSRSVNGACVIEFSWDWSDRSPDRVELFGRFFPYNALTNPAPNFSGGFQLSMLAAPGDKVVVKFTGANPSITSAHTGTVEELLPTPPGGNRRYRLRIEGMTCDFTGVPQLALSVTARGAERVRPAELSAVVGPRVARTNDPLPTPPPILSIDLKWTALPDAANKAHGTLRWPMIPNADGYIVWEATESALRFAVDPALPQHDPSQPLLARAGALRSLVTRDASTQAKSLRAFTRMNDHPLESNSLDLTLPGASDTLYAYRVSTITKTGMESGRSETIALFAVPRRNQPGQPRLMLRLVKQPVPGINVIVIPGPGKTAAGYRVHRTRNAAMTGDIGLMGPPKILPNDANWRDINITSLDGKVEQARAVFDPVTPSWYAYHYRIVGIGREDLLNGEYAGESLPSAVQSLVLPPDTPPLLDTIDVIGHNMTNTVIRFHTDLPVKMSPVGPALIEVIEQVPDSTSMRRRVVLSIKADEVKQGTPFTLIALPSESQLRALPEINRIAPDPEGWASYTVRMKTNPDAVALSVAVTDPLKHTIERQIGEA